MEDSTAKFNLSGDRTADVHALMSYVLSALKEKGYKNLKGKDRKKKDNKNMKEKDRKKKDNKSKKRQDKNKKESKEKKKKMSVYKN